MAIKKIDKRIKISTKVVVSVPTVYPDLIQVTESPDLDVVTLEFAKSLNSNKEIHELGSFLISKQGATFIVAKLLEFLDEGKHESVKIKSGRK